MKLIFLIFSGTILLLTVSSCQNKGEADRDSLASEFTEAIEKAGKTADEFKGKLDELLTLEMASKVSGYESKLAEKDYTKGGSFESIKYVWKETKRTRKIEYMKGRFIDAPVKDFIELSWVKNITLEQFKRSYHNLTKEEIANAEAVVEAKTKEMQDKGSVSEDQAKAAKAITSSSLKKQKVTEAPNVGDYSVFINGNFMGVETKDLKVFYQGLSFTIQLDLSDDPVYNEKKAIEVARLIIKEKL